VPDSIPKSESKKSIVDTSAKTPAFHTPVHSPANSIVAPVVSANAANAAINVAPVVSATPASSLPIVTPSGPPIAANDTAALQKIVNSDDTIEYIEQKVETVEYKRTIYEKKRSSEQKRSENSNPPPYNPKPGSALRQKWANGSSRKAVNDRK